MPQIVICGYPSSGKSTLAVKLSNYFKEDRKIKDVFIVREEEHLAEHKNNVLDDSRKEKILRGQVKSEAQRLISKESVVIIDALNYIKGYRYELFCMSKAIPTRQVTIQCDISEELAWEWNAGRAEKDQYSRTVFDHLIQRFELPDPQNRWDSPFFSTLPNEELDFESVYNSLYHNRPPKPNESTKSKTLSESNYLSSLEKITSDIIQALIQNQKQSKELGDDEIEMPHSKVKFMSIQDREVLSLAQLTRFKRQFLNLSKNSSVKGDVGDMFVQYLNTQLRNK